MRHHLYCCLFIFTAPATTEIYTLSLHDALPICPPYLSLITWMPFVGVLLIIFTARRSPLAVRLIGVVTTGISAALRSEEHTSELQSRRDLVCRLLLEKKKNSRQSGYRYRRRNAR